MLFNSLHFIAFLPIVVIVYFCLSHKWRTFFLLIASYYFYMCWKPEYALLILGSTLIDYYAAIRIYNATAQNNRKLWLLISLSSNLGILFLFKYFNFFSSSVHSIFQSFNIFYDKPVFELLLPVGISFYTFQTLSYTIDVYRKKLEPDSNFLRFALYVSFFPQLVAGPIERATNLLPQLKQHFAFDYDRVLSGIRLIAWGFFKKIVIADRLAVYVNAVYDNADAYQGFPLIWATLFFGTQIYCDFSGYSDIAIGSARIMGFELTRNFNIPYLSKSIREFWTRWHISLSTWFRDYLYIPIGGNRVVKWRWYYNLLITFVISGLWHGANWTFVTWGAAHGIFLILEHIAGKYIAGNSVFKRIAVPVVRILFTYILVHITWIIFRAGTISEVIYIFGNMFQFNSGLIGVPVFSFYSFILCIAAFSIFLFFDIVARVDFYSRSFKFKKPVYDYLFLSLITIIIYMFGVFENQAFIYFQF